MATTTPNFGWPVPTSTDLVKDGAVAIEGLGDAIDASLLDLKGGTTNQVLAKNSNTDMDFKWVADASGIPATILDAKGDIIAATAADTASRLAVGANGTVLTADSAEATGLKWAVPASGSTFVGCAVTNYVQSINSGTWTALTYTVEDYDTDAFHNNSTNTSRMTIPAGKGGKYQLTASGDFNDIGTAGTLRGIRLYKNGALYESPTTGAVLRSIFGNVGTCTNTIDWTITLAATDYLEIYAFQDTGSARNINNNLFCITYLGA